MIFITIIPLLLNNCNKEPSPTPGSTYLDIAYVNKLNKDLLDSTTQNYFSASGIMVYDVVNGVKKEVNYGNLTYPHNFFIYKNDSLKEFFLRVFLETDTTFLQLNQSITDTITSIINNRVLTKAWYNGVLKWDGGYHTITITK